MTYGTWLPLTCSSVCPTECWKEREIEYGVIPLPYCAVSAAGCSSSPLLTDRRNADRPKSLCGPMNILKYGDKKDEDGFFKTWILFSFFCNFVEFRNIFSQNLFP